MLLTRLVIQFFSYLCGRVKDHPGQTIVIILALLATIYTVLTYYHNVQESEEENKTAVTLEAQMDFSTIYFSNFHDLEVFRPKISWQDPWPEHGSDFGEFRWFGLHPLVSLKILNESKHPISVNHVKGCLSFGNYTGEDEWSEYFKQGIGEKAIFPLFLQPHEERIVFLPLTWPITDAVKEWLPNLTPDSLYTARYLVSDYLRRKCTLIVGSPEVYGLFLKDILFQDLIEQIGSNSIATGNIELKVVLSTGEYFTENIVLR